MYISIIELIVCNRIILGSVGLTANRPELVIIIKNISGEQDKNNVKISVCREMKIFEFTELKNRFEIRPPRWKARHYIWELTSFLLMAGAGVWLFFCWDSISEEVAVHFDIQGQIDRKDSKEHLLIVWGISCFSWLTMSLLCFFPGLFNFPVKVTEENRKRLESLGVDMILLLNLIIMGMFSHLLYCMAYSRPTMCPLMFTGAFIVVIIWFMIQCFRLR